MEISSKQRAYLRRLAVNEPVICHIGKADITPALIKQVDDALTARELIKCSLQRGATMTTQQVLDELCQQTSAIPVAQIGRRCVLYRANPEKPGIRLP